ncbi:MAG: peptidoglycan-associated lipoprotein Pal [candidate division NC10 bacterium]|nr:peptidoglycan-associated lipoprotein Pal [candidate division NC10 bacterium]MDE2320907.1 peptidoglycan-associated lipoprotein Pal [candidate division NC10 bacterium]
MQRKWIGSTITLVGVALFLTGCPKKPEVVETAPSPMAMQAPKAAAPEKTPTEVAPQPPETKVTPEAGAVPEAQVAEAEMKAGTSAKAAESALHDIYFDFDRSEIREDAKKLLAADIEWLKKDGAAKVTIEGHCDERGTSEYNLALGERRARATRDYLVAAGIAANRISTISFGKERPFALGHDESAWKWNRRAHFVLSAK